MNIIDQGLVKNLKELNLNALKRDDLGPFSFSDAHDAIRKSVDFFNFFIDSKEPELPNSKYHNLENKLKDFLNRIEKIKSFDPKSASNVAQEHTNLIQEINSFWEGLFNEFHSLYGFLSIQRGGLKEIVKNLKQTQVNFTDAVEQARKNNQETSELIKGQQDDAQEVKQKIEETLRAASEFSAKDVVSKYSTIFDDQAEKVHRPKIRYWWKVVGISIFLEIAIAFLLLWIYLEYFLEASTTISIGLAVIKLFILSAGAVFVTQAIKNLNAHNHLYTLNKFRSNSLSSFKAFIQSTTDDQVKDALIIQMAKAIFDSNISGYLSKDDSSQDFVSIEIIKQLLKK